MAPDLILLRPSLINPLPEVLSSLREKWAQSPVIGLLCTKWNHSSGSVFQSFLHGLDDFLSCPFKEIDVIPRIQRLLHWKEKVFDPVSTKITRERMRRESLVGESQSFLRVVEKIPLLARSDATILISGETGTGKELVARAIHCASSRKDKAFIPINCGALPRHFFEDELSGHTKKVQADASPAKREFLPEAKGGTIFLEEIDALIPSAQIKLLRFLQDRKCRLNGYANNIPSDIRVIAATSSDLHALVKAKRFREDLYHQLKVLSVALPPLRERIDDVPLLANYFLIKHGRELSRAPLRFSAGAMQKLMAYPWPGNIQELEGVIQRAVILTFSSTLQPGEIDLLPYQRDVLERGTLREAKAQTIERFERAYLTDLLISHFGNVSRAARAAGKERRAFQRLLRKYGLERSTFQS